jgi:MFS-type transporter involved in bile tolerance (Atg22 family)
MSIILAFTGSLQYAMISIVLFNLIGILGMYFVSEK